jgi:hypothetical protein
MKPAEEPPPGHPAAWHQAVESASRAPCRFCDKFPGGNVYRRLDNDEVAICPACLENCRELLAAKPITIEGATGAASKLPLRTFDEVKIKLQGLLA